MPYDELVLATGANPVRPVLPGNDLKGITTLLSMEDADFLLPTASGAHAVQARPVF